MQITFERKCLQNAALIFRAFLKKKEADLRKDPVIRGALEGMGIRLLVNTTMLKSGS